MKNKLICCAFLLTVCCSYAQDVVTADFKSFRTGFTVTPLSINWFSSVSSPFEKDGVSFAVVPEWFFEFQLHERIYLNTGLSYSTLGGKLRFPTDVIGGLPEFTTNVNVNREYSLHYLEIPLMVKIYTNKINKWAFYGGLGTRLGMKTSAIAQNEYRDFSYKPIGADKPLFTGTFFQEENITKKIKFLNVAAAIEVGTTYDVAPGLAVVLSANYKYGLTDVFTKNHEVVNNVFLDAKMQQFSICLGLIF